jgi:hypothetical protein
MLIFKIILMFKIIVSGVRWGKVNGETAHDYLGLFGIGTQQLFDYLGH